METALLEELETIRRLMEGAKLAADTRSTALWCLGQLPHMYREFRETYDIRYGDEIRRLVEGLRAALAEATGVREVITDRLVAMHARLGIPALKLAAIKQPRRRKAG